jgi:GNAT superfamily N-acetyltransferase
MTVHLPQKNAASIELEHIKRSERGDLVYWNMLGSLSGINDNTQDGLRWLSGKIYWNYLTETDDVDNVIQRIQNNETPGRLFMGTVESNFERIKLYLDTGRFNLFTDCTIMAHELSNAAPIKPGSGICIIRVQDASQLKAAADIHRSDGKLFTHKNYNEIMRRSETQFYVAEVDGIPAAMCMTQYIDDYVGITWVHTLDEYRRRGLAGYLIQTAEQDAVQQGKKYGMLSAFPGAVGAYKRVGYKEITKTVSLHSIYKKS